MLIFIIVGGGDPIYEIDLGNPAGKSGSDSSSLSLVSAERGYLHQFVAHSSIDVIETSMWTNDFCYLKLVDKFDSYCTSAYVTLGGRYFLLLHDGRDEDQLRLFFQEAHDIYARYLMNPFIEADGPISCIDFDSMIGAAARKLSLA
jgi:trafficking protein particle complex subunit 2